MFEDDAINALEGDGKYTRPKLGQKTYSEKQIVDFLFDLGHGVSG